MEQYISKSALLAEIDRQKIGYNVDGKHSIEYDITRKILNIINTLEVKEVDLKEEIKEVQRRYKTIEEYEGYPCTMYANDIEWIARHFFELGMKVSNKAQKGDV